MKPGCRTFVVFASYHPESPSFFLIPKCPGSACSPLPTSVARGMGELCQPRVMSVLSSQAIHRPVGELASTMWLPEEPTKSPCYFFAACQTNDFTVACNQATHLRAFLHKVTVSTSLLVVDTTNQQAFHLSRTEKNHQTVWLDEFYYFGNQVYKYVKLSQTKFLYCFFCK